MTLHKARKSTNYVPLFILLAGVVVIWVVYWMILIRFPFQGDVWDARGKFGDMFGALNALFTACAFAALLWGIRLEYKAFRRQELHTVLSAQLDSLVQLAALPDPQRAQIWRAIVNAPGGPGDSYTIERAIGVQIAYIDRLMTGEDPGIVPTYGRPPAAHLDGSPLGA
jgi:hypothetical protein